jgi:hypothetical protein
VWAWTSPTGHQHGNPLQLIASPRDCARAWPRGKVSRTWLLERRTRAAIVGVDEIGVPIMTRRPFRAYPKPDTPTGEKGAQYGDKLSFRASLELACCGEPLPKVGGSSFGTRFISITNGPVDFGCPAALGGRRVPQRQRPDRILAPPSLARFRPISGSSHARCGSGSRCARGSGRRVGRGQLRGGASVISESVPPICSGADFTRRACPPNLESVTIDRDGN